MVGSEGRTPFVTKKPNSQYGWAFLAATPFSSCTP